MPDMGWDQASDAVLLSATRGDPDAFAVFYDPQNSAQTPVVSEFINLLALLIYMATNGHLRRPDPCAAKKSAFPMPKKP